MLCRHYGYQAHQMKIKCIETYATKHVGLTCVTADTGDQGWGQVSTYNADISVEVLHRQVASHAIGASMENLDDLLDRIYELEHKFPGSYLCRALGGLDTAIWDLRGKIQRQPVIFLLGGKPGKLRVYGSSMKRDITPAAELQRFVRLRDQFGYDAFKFRVGSECGRDADEWPGRSEQIVETVSKGLDDEVALLVDANSGFTPKRAIELGRQLEDCGILHFESLAPIGNWSRRGKSAVRSRSMLTGGEQDCDLTVWRRIIADRVVDIAQPDVCYVGGLSRAMRVAAMAAEAGLPVTPHAANLSLVTVFTMHFLGAIPNAGKYLELSIEGSDYYPWQQGLFLNPPFAVEDGKVDIPSDPGWSVEINPKWLAQAQYRKSG